MTKPVTLGYSIHACTGQGARLQRPVILVRGLGRSSGFWLQFLQEVRIFAEVICIDLYGTGKSPNTWGRNSVLANSCDLIETSKKGGFENSHLVGISFGGMVALQAAVDVSANFGSLSVMSSSAGSTGLPRLNLKAALKLLAALRNSPPKNREFASFLVSSATLQKIPNLPEVWDKIWVNEGFYPIAVVRQLLAAGVFSGAESLTKIKTPCHFMVSQQDALVPWQNTVEMWRMSEAFRLTVLKGWGHDFPTEAPLEVAHKIFEFCKEFEP